MKTKVYKVELLIIDHENWGEKEIKNIIENTRYPAHAISPEVMTMELREIEWGDDDHPLNFYDTREAEFKRLFANP